MAALNLHYDIDGENFVAAGEASAQIKKMLKKMGLPGEVVRKVAIAMYEGEINTVIHGGGGFADVEITGDSITMVLTDHGPGIPDVEKAMQSGYSTAPEEVRALGFGAGMGLPNMQKNTDEMTIDTEVGVGTTITMKVNLAG